MKLEWDIVTRHCRICGAHYKSTTSTVVSIVFCMAWLGSKALAWAQLRRAWAHKNLELGPSQWLGLSLAGLSLSPGFRVRPTTTCDCFWYISATVVNHQIISFSFSNYYHIWCSFSLPLHCEGHRR